MLKVKFETYIADIQDCIENIAAMGNKVAENFSDCESPDNVYIKKAIEVLPVK